MSKIDKIKIALLYFFLFAGGLWHFLNFFQTIMSYLAGPLLIGLSIWLYSEIKTNDKAKFFSKFDIWAIIVIIFSLFIEAIGVKTGQIFGKYNYGETLWPQIMNVPIAIGFAWFLMLICSIALMQRLPIINNSNFWIQIFIISILMTFFDFMMEPAAIKLNYWSWYKNTVPIQNYFAWFVISFILMILAWQMKVLKLKFTKVVMHGYFAQLVYFIMIMFK
jgi:uncharacterized membrane protein